MVSPYSSQRANTTLPNKSTRPPGWGRLKAYGSKTGERQTAGPVDVWRAHLGAYGLHLDVNGVSWTCPAMAAWAIEEIADGLEGALD